MKININNTNDTNNTDNINMTNMATKISLATAVMCLSTAVMANKARDITVIPLNTAENVKLTLDVADGRDTVRIGDEVAFCFSTEKAGYVSMWNVGTSGKVSKIYPYQEQSVIRPVQANKKECVGNSRFRVSGPTGIENVVLYWTAEPAGQIAMSEQKDIKSLAEAIEKQAKQVVERSGWDAWATTTASFAVIDGQNSGAAQNPANVAPHVPTNTAQPQGTTQGTAQPQGTSQQQGAAQGTAQGTAQPQGTSQQQGAAQGTATQQGSAQQQSTSKPPQVRPVRTTLNDYQNVYILSVGSDVGKLKKTNDDAQLFVNVASTSFSVPPDNIRLLKNAKRQEIIDSFSWLSTNVQANDLVMFFYSGHGARIPDDNGDEADGLDEALVPYDLNDPKNTNNPNLYIRDDEIKQWFEKIPARTIVSFFDACHSGGMYRSFSPSAPINARRKLFTEGIANVSPHGQAKSRDIDVLEKLTENNAKYAMMAASKEMQYALEEPGKGGLFTVGLASLLQLDLPEIKNWEDFSVVLSAVVDDVSQGHQTPTAVDPNNVLQQLQFRD